MATNKVERRDENNDRIAVINAYAPGDGDLSFVAKDPRTTVVVYPSPTREECELALPQGWELYQSGDNWRARKITTPRPKVFEFTFDIYNPGELAAGLRSYSDRITIKVDSGEPGGEPGEFQEHIRESLLEWFDGATVTPFDPEKLPEPEPGCSQWLGIPMYGHFYRLNDGGVEYRPMMEDGTLCPDEDQGGFIDPFEGCEDALKKLDSVIEDLLTNPESAESKVIREYLADPVEFMETARRLELPVICEEHSIVFGERCKCF